MIELDNVTRTYGRKVAVDRLTLTVSPGELFALLGPNGAGKTTAIKMLAGLLRPATGTVQSRQAARSLGYVPDEPYLYDKLSGREFLRFAAEMRGLERPDVKARIARVTESFDLGEFLDELTETYSHGMKQRLVFASALLHDPAVLIIDEPMVGLDPRSVRLVKDLLRRRAEAGTAILMSTHTLAVAEEVANRIGIMDTGRLRFVGTLPELRQKSSGRHGSLESLYLELTDGRGDQTDPTQSPQAELPP